MIELVKILKGMYDPKCVSHLDFIELTEELIMVALCNRADHYIFIYGRPM